MKHTPEQLARLSDGALNEIMHLLMNDFIHYPEYCRSWRVTGPLIEKHKVDLTWQVDNWEAVADIDEDNAVLVLNSDPLRAVVECLILVLQEGEL